MKNFFKVPFLFLSVVLFLTVISCHKEEIIPTNNLSSLPNDTGGEHLSQNLSGANIYGHYIYIPGGYERVNSDYPLILFLHGSGEKGNSQNNPEDLTRVLRGGIPRMIEKNLWKPAYPALVASPQCHDGWWDAKKIHAFIKYLADKYRVNMDRIYITGLSMGAYGTFDYVGTYGDSSYVAAAVPIAGGGSVQKAKSFVSTPVWAFHGDADNTVLDDRSIEMVEAINNHNPSIKAKLTIYPNVGHDSWTMTYNGTGMGKESKDYDPFSEDIYTWMFKYSKKPN